MNSEIVQAIAQRRLMELSYDGLRRTVEPHAYGVTAHGHEVIRVWQTSGGSANGEPTGWKLLRVDEARVTALGERFEGPRPGYKRGDKAMSRIFAEL